MFILINIPSWDIQSPGKECANITHSLVGLYLAGNVCKVDTQCPSMECANNCTLCKRTLGLRWVTTFELGKLILWSFLSAKHFCSFSVSFMTNLRDSLLFVCALWKKQTASYYFFRTFIDKSNSNNENWLEINQNVHKIMTFNERAVETINYQIFLLLNACSLYHWRQS